jgi:hypothetical protein
MIEAEIVNQCELFRREHDLQTFVSQFFLHGENPLGFCSL